MNTPNCFSANRRQDRPIGRCQRHIMAKVLTSLSCQLTRFQGLSCCCTLCGALTGAQRPGNARCFDTPLRAVSTGLGELAVDLEAAHTCTDRRRCAPHAWRRAVYAQRMLSRVLSRVEGSAPGRSASRCPREASSRLAIRPPKVSARPEVGSVMRERILSNVDLPASLRSMTPALHHTCPGGQCQGTQCGASVPSTSPCLILRPGSRRIPAYGWAAR